MTKRLGLILAGAILGILMICVLATCGKTESSPYEESSQTTQRDIYSLLEEHNGLIAEYNEAVMAYNESIQGVIDENTTLEQEIATAQNLIDAGDVPFDPQTAIELDLAIQTALEGKIVAPEMLPIKSAWSVPEGAATEEIDELRSDIAAESEFIRNSEVPTPLDVPDYTAFKKTLIDAQNAFECSVLIQEQVTAPADAFVMERLKQIDTIVSIAAVSKNNDPNGLLGTEGGYIGCIYFSDSRIDKTLLNLKPGEYDAISMGTVGGGAIEVYTSVEKAEKRNVYLTSYDGTNLDPGAHVVVGTMVVRTSSMFADEQQEEMMGQIIALLTELVG